VVAGKGAVQGCPPQPLVVGVATAEKADPEPERQFGDHVRRGGHRASPAQLADRLIDLGARAVVQVGLGVVPPVVLAEQLEQVLVFGQTGLAEHAVQVLGVVLLHRRSLSRQAARASVDDISPGIASASTQPGAQPYRRPAVRRRQRCVYE
jgi:hypothetical protein